MISHANWGITLFFKITLWSTRQPLNTENPLCPFFFYLQKIFLTFGNTVLWDTRYVYKEVYFDRSIVTVQFPWNATDWFKKTNFRFTLSISQWKKNFFFIINKHGILFYLRSSLLYLIKAFRLSSASSPRMRRSKFFLRSMDFTFCCKKCKKEI